MNGSVVTVLGCVLCVSCATAVGEGRKGTEEPAAWTEETLDEYQIQALTTGSQGLTGISGRVVEVFSAIEEDLNERGKKCGESFFATHLFFYREDAHAIEVHVHPRLRPDPENKLGEIIDDGGTRRLRLPLISGASAPDGCFLTYKLQKSNGMLTTSRP